jgi:hypothetical protein
MSICLKYKYSTVTIDTLTLVVPSASTSASKFLQHQIKTLIKKRIINGLPIISALTVIE